MIRQSLLISLVLMGAFELLLILMLVTRVSPHDNEHVLVTAIKGAAEANFWFGLLQPIAVFGFCWMVSIVLLMVRRRPIRR